MISKTYYRYIWLLNLLLNARHPLTFEEICMKWEECPAFEGTLPIRTFHEHRKGVREMFGVNIACDKSKGNVYYVENPEILEGNRAGKWLLEKYSIPEGFTAYLDMKDRILFEEIHSGTRHIDDIMEAMRKNVEISVDYQKYDSEHAETFIMQPYALKVFNLRWYLLGCIKGREGLRNIALDRIIAIEILNTRFELPKDFNAKRYYSNYTGIYVDKNLPIEKVKIRAYGTQVDYLRSLPLHKSQEEVYTKYREYSDFTYRVCITPELISKILAMGDKVEVLEPKSLREKIKEQLQITLNRYGNE
jgi:hypothetical protein